ncbi:MAG TPA: potassium channel family protein [Candidatus Omnitrophota bacterium]|nr:potassium channel family protein [Candidatus Omnitrophota bacterium]
MLSSQHHSGIASKPSRVGAFRFSMEYFLLSLILLIAATPLLEEWVFGVLVESLLLTLVLLSAVFAVASNRRSLIIASVLVIPPLVMRWIRFFSPESLWPESVFLPAVIFMVYVIWHLLRFILRAPCVDKEVLCAGIATYLTLGLMWAFIYILLSNVDPGSFRFTSGPMAQVSMRGFTGIYFSLVTLTTAGYGDVIPVSSLARMLAAMEAVTGVLYVAVLISRLVALHASESMARRSGER